MRCQVEYGVAQLHTRGVDGCSTDDQLIVSLVPHIMCLVWRRVLQVPC
jgi:hypothetical protein